MQSSPNSAQAAHASALLRNANDSVEDARGALARGEGEGEWLPRLHATLAAVQQALNALKSF